MSESNFSVKKLLELKKDFDSKFPPRNIPRDTSVLAEYLGQEYGFKIISKDIPNDTIAVSSDVYLILLGKQK